MAFSKPLPGTLTRIAAQRRSERAEAHAVFAAQYEAARAAYPELPAWQVAADDRGILADGDRLTACMPLADGSELLITRNGYRNI